MQKTKDMPIWVFLAYSSIETRKVALWLIWGCVIFALYCIPWGTYFAKPTWLTKLFLIDDWSWFTMMVPITAWYWLSMRWIDKHSGWPDAAREKDHASA